jgi:cell wall-associated NlpC family hydrolase
VSAVAEAALATVGARFRLHGRAPEHGLDCVGLVAVALRAGGYAGAVPSGYALRGGDPAAVLDAALVRCDGMAAGDVLLMATGPGQLHLAVRTARGFVHADAGLRRVVERAVADWPVVGAWRLQGRMEV